jgi:hypothetical protein
VTNPQLFFDTFHVDGVDALLTEFGPGAFASPFRSTVPLVALVKDDFATFSEVVNACGMQGDLSVHFEYKVPVPGVAGNPSQTDAMVLCGGSALAIEAKWTEPRYEMVAKRLAGRIAKLIDKDPGHAKEHEASQRAVIDGWLRLLGTNSKKPLSIEGVGDVVYQMIHRAASACSMSRFPSLVYIHFEPTPAKGAASTSQYRADLQNLHRLLGGPGEFPFYLVKLPLRLSEAFMEIQSLRKGSPETDLRVRKAIGSARLFEFGEPHVERIS